ncbi:hypothetical protein OE766_23140 [Pararhizobium sp. YC-54]|nr:hypothetical protein [Pararhizobium sp. YC-54]MCW0001126.1 hypothetical protein [Pararhizobium sp. YC-54]
MTADDVMFRSTAWSLSDIRSGGAVTGAHKGHAFFAYATNYLIDTDHGVILDVEATRVIGQAEVFCQRTGIAESGLPTSKTLRFIDLAASLSGQQLPRIRIAMSGCYLPRPHPAGFFAIALASASATDPSICTATDRAQPANLRFAQPGVFRFTG